MNLPDYFFPVEERSVAVTYNYLSTILVFELSRSMPFML